eukprot:CAMPEP_0194030068 /NCGR_PEP_ID=MMETSP0009_2-20130614/3667_1 /TAXON_ID=210454 /ORGANISM="Grammatophora oceanica, Strain CCMP 410" /LENGTH=66 /DNA_ID=CAMNT_0038669939 /DNA_START=301 /DNA_END=498 /DNA_ORIENTATION=+
MVGILVGVDVAQADNGAGAGIGFATGVGFALVTELWFESSLGEFQQQKCWKDEECNIQTWLLLQTK